MNLYTDSYGAWLTNIARARPQVRYKQRDRDFDLCAACHAKARAGPAGEFIVVAAPLPSTAELGLGCIIVLYYRATTSYQIC